MSDLLTELGYAPVMATHPRAYILDEMSARGWEPQELAERLGDGGGHGLNALGWLLYFMPGSEEIRLGPAGAADLARVFGTSTEVWLELERQWLERKQ